MPSFKSFRLAAKAFITHSGKLLIVKRSNYTQQKPGIWELPGGRLEPGENPFLGLQREVKEETGLKVSVQSPLSVRHFERSDHQVITLVIFLCKAQSKKVVLSREHTDFEWIAPKKAGKLLSDFYSKELAEYRKRNRV